MMFEGRNRSEFLLETLVLLEEPPALLLGGLAQAHRLGDHRGDDGQQPDILERSCPRRKAGRSRGADDFVASLIGTQMNERSLFLRLLRAPVRSRKSGPPRCGERPRLSGLHDLAGDALADAVAAALLLAGREAVGRLDGDLAGVAVEQRGLRGASPCGRPSP